MEERSFKSSRDFSESSQQSFPGYQPEDNERHRLGGPLYYDLPRSSKPPVRQTIARARYNLAASLKRSNTPGMHQELKEPQFEKLSSIYEAHVKAPTVNQAPPRTREWSATSSRSLSAPRRRTTEQLAKEREDKLQEECTFRPAINKLYQSKQTLSASQRFLSLSRPKTDKIERLQREKRGREEAELCPFRPQINSHLKSVDSSDLPIEERLHQEARQKSQERERYRRDLLEAQVSVYPFRPQVQASLRKLVGAQKEKPPIYQRVSEVQREKQERLERLREESVDGEANFTPQINPQSKRLALARREKIEAKGLSATQRISPSVQEPSTPQLSVQSSGSFLERQQLMHERLLAKRKELLSRVEQYTFRPKIDKTSLYITAADTARSNQSMRQKVDRWSKEEHAKRAARLRARQAEKENEFSYEPKINSLSKQLGRTASCQNLSSNEKVLQDRKRKAEERMTVLQQACSFTPNINASKKYQRSGSGYSQRADILSSIEQQRRLKQKRLDELKQKRDFDSMQGCTFKPELDERKIKIRQEVSVRGLDRFMELKEMAKRKEEEARAREEQVFGGNGSFVAPFPHTVPQPFNLCPSQKKEKVERVKNQVEVEERSQCTFTPRISEAQGLHRKGQMFNYRMEYEMPGTDDVFYMRQMYQRCEWEVSQAKYYLEG